MAVVNKLDIFEKVCRTCNNQPTNLLNIFDVEPLGRKSISEMISFCSQAPVSRDDLYPQQICYFCVKKLEISYKFLKQCQQANTEFDKVLNYYIEKDTGVITDVQEIKVEINKCTTNVEEDNCEGEVENCISERFKYSDDCGVQVEYVDDAEISQILTNYEDEPSTKTLKEHIQITNEIHDPIDKGRNENEPKVGCDYCTKLFLTTKALQLHTKIVHKKQKLKRLH